MVKDNRKNYTLRGLSKPILSEVICILYVIIILHKLFIIKCCIMLVIDTNYKLLIYNLLMCRNQVQFHFFILSFFPAWPHSHSSQFIFAYFEFSAFLYNLFSIVASYLLLQIFVVTKPFYLGISNFPFPNFSAYISVVWICWKCCKVVNDWLVGATKGY